MEKVDTWNDELLCGGFICSERENDYIHGEILSQVHKSTLCDHMNCINTAVEEKLCADAELDGQAVYIKMPSGKSLQEKLLCDDKCDDFYCEDEGNCNGLRYGLYCTNRFNPWMKSLFVHTNQICDGFQDCLNGEDEKNCNITIYSCLLNENFAYSDYPVTLPLTNITRCFPFEPRRLIYNFTHCQDFMDQTNCSDWARVGVTCKINNFTSTVSKYMMCAMKTPLCDDGMETICLDVTTSCRIHKHRLCDGTADCAHEMDENYPLCLEMTAETCNRTALPDGTPRKIPLEWLHDGIVDCMDGKDEQPIWPKCGVHGTERFLADRKAEKCENVFLCPNSQFVRYKDLCDGFESCGIENRVCKVSREYLNFKTTALSYVSGPLPSITFALSYCLRGAENLLLLQNMKCHAVSYRFPNDNFFGVPNKNIVYLPYSGSTLQNCDYLYGENYVWTSCVGNCLASPCPLKVIPRYDSCPGQIPNRVGTLVGNKHLTFLTKSRGVYHNNVFVCTTSKQCLEYSKVCDLVEDCADGSDEVDCTNHFECKGDDRYIPITQKCDGTIDCLDASDECNERCNHTVLGDTVGLASWVMAVMAIAGNTIVILLELEKLRQCKTIDDLANKCFIILIAFGDLLMGIYLLWVSITHSVVYGEDYCKEQWFWLTSLNCSILGVLSTAGTQISLFSMSTLSLFRACTITSRIRIANEVTLVGKLKLWLLALMVLATSFTLALIPLAPYLEDFFVNGMHYDPRLKLFIRFLFF